MTLHRVIPIEWLTPARIVRVVIHWTAGGYHVGAVDREHYHCILQDDEALEARAPSEPGVTPFPGVYSPADNDSTVDRRYAAHTLGLNTGSYGLSAACMAGAKQGGPYGSAPLTHLLWERLAQAAADVCAAYRLDVTERTVLQHGEVQRVYGKVQRGKWDCTELPFEPGLEAEDVCEQFRRKVTWYLREYHGR